jgi:hypothetical protein
MVSAFGTVFVGVVAILPIIREAFHKRKNRDVLRDLIYVEVRDLNESYQGKLDTHKNNWAEPMFAAEIPDNDFMFFKSLVNSFEKSTYLTSRERELIGELVKIFREETYHKIPKNIPEAGGMKHIEVNAIKKKGVEKIISKTHEILELLKSKLDLSE